MSAPDFVTVLLTVVGAFYAFAGVVATRAGLSSRLMDIALAGIGGEAPKRAETARALWMTLAGLLILAGGVALLLRVDVAAWAFTISALAQGVYLAIVAPRLLDPDDPPSPEGRKQTINAFVLYLAATAFVLWAWSAGRLHAWETLPMPLVPLAALGVCAFAGHAVYTFLKPLGRRS